jgi:hypothetical protein
MYNELNTYVDARIVEANATISGSADDFVKMDIDLDIELISDNQKHNHYMTKINSYEERESQAEIYDFDAEIELSFIIPNSDTVKYKAVMDNYVWVLVKKIRATRYYNPSDTIAIFIQQVGIKDGNQFNEGEFNPKITLKGYTVVT